MRALASNDPPLPVSLEEIEARDRRWLEGSHADSAWFAIDADEEAIGMCGLHEIDHFHARADVGIRLGTQYWGKGYGQDAVRTLVTYGFRMLNLEKISLHVSPTTNAVGAYTKAGFVEEGPEPRLVRRRPARRAGDGRVPRGRAEPSSRSTAYRTTGSFAQSKSCELVEPSHDQPARS